MNKTQHLFFGILIDYAHEQTNKLVKSDGGTIGLTENSIHLLWWMVCSPEVAKVINEFDGLLANIRNRQCRGSDLHHCKQVKGVHATLKLQVLDLTATVEDMETHLKNI